MNRREFVEAAVASGAALSLGTARAHAEATASMSGVNVLFDARYSDARMFADASRRLGAAVFDSPSDPVSLWRDMLASASRPDVIAGLTAHSDLVILQSCALEIGLKLKREIFHDSRGSFMLQHRIAKGATPSVVRELSEAGIAWPAALARVIAAPAAANVLATGAAALRAPKSPDHPGTLVSWLLA